MTTVQVLDADGPVEIVLDRPGRSNALTLAVVEDLHDALDDVEACDVTVAVLRGAGGTFSSGLDLDAFADGVPDEFHTRWRDLHERIYRSPLVLVGAIERHAINGGAALALANDFLVAGQGTRLVVGEVALGAPAPMNTAWLTLRTTHGIATRVLLSGTPLVGDDLLRLGLCHEVVADDDVVDAARRLATRLAAHPPGALETIKSALRAVNPDGAQVFRRAGAVQPATDWTSRRMNP